jgi:hypothetical protein
MTQTVRTWARLVGGAAILAVLVWRLGTGPFLDGLRTINGWSLAAAGGITAVTTVCSAWRWSLVARGLGVEVPLRSAIPAYYRSQFINTVLPGGVLGDVNRGMRHGRDVGDVGRGLRAVAWERAAGQTVQVVLTLLVLLIVPPPLHVSMPAVVSAVVVGAIAAVLLMRALPRGGASRWARVLRAAGEDIHDGLLARRAWPGITVASVVAAAGSTASLSRLLPVAMIVMVATAVPTNIGGWGPREGVAAWLFGAAGLGAGHGLATSTVYGVMVVAASLPGAVVLIASRNRRGHRREVPAADTAAHGLVGDAIRWSVPDTAPLESAVGG